MSLVNDMLKDLDARRREAPTHSLGAEKLVPASERVAAAKKSRSVWIVLALSAVLIGLLGMYLFLSGQSSGQITSPIVLPPVAEVQTGNINEPLEPEQELMAQVMTDDGVSPAQQTDVQQNSSEALLRLEARLQQLEAQNQALLESQQREAEAIAAAMNVSGQQNPAEPQLAEDVWINSEWANAPALPAEETEPQSFGQASPDINAASAPATQITPRTMSLQDRDRQAVQLALQQWSSGQRLAALQTLDMFAYENPEAHGSRETLAKLLIQQGEPERAMQAVELGLSIAPNNNAYKKIKARLDIEQGRAEDALTLLLRSPPAAAVDTEYHDLMANAYLTAQRYDVAAMTYQTLLQIDPAEGRWWYALAASYDAQGMSTDAAQAYDRALLQTNLSLALRQATQQRLQLLRQSSAAR